MSSTKSKVMLINVTHAEESRVVILTDGILDAFEIETVDQRSRKGDIYNARIENVQPALQAAFVDIGDERSAFLPLDELNFSVYPSRKEGGRGRIENHLRRGQNVLVQIVRDAFATKPPTVSTYYSLPGRYLVLTPHNRSSGVSRKLDDKNRDRIRKLMDELQPPEPHGLIARTAVASATKQDMQRDLKYLLRLWEQIETASSKAPPPSLIYQERSMVIRAMRDLYTPDIDDILVDHETTYEEICEFFTIFAPHRKKVVKQYQGHRPIFNKYNVEEQIENIFRRRVPLPSGGAVIFDTTEALTAIDVNSGKMKKEGHIEETATRANIEAAQEIARQLRLRDIGGLIVIDFIDMRQVKNIRQVEKAMRDALKRDKARYDVTRLSRLALMEISRERVGAQKASLRYKDCPTCGGTGSIKTVEAAAMQALRRLQTRVVRGDLASLELIVPPDVAEYILNNKREEIGAWEGRYRTRVSVRGNPDLGRDDFEIGSEEHAEPEEKEALVSLPTGQEMLAEIELEESDDEAETGTLFDDEELAPLDQENGDVEEKVGEDGVPKKKRRRRRRRRGSRGRGGSQQPAAASQVTDQDAAVPETTPAPASAPSSAPSSAPEDRPQAGAPPTEPEKKPPRFLWWRKLVGN